MIGAKDDSIRKLKKEDPVFGKLKFEFSKLGDLVGEINKMLEKKNG